MIPSGPQKRGQCLAATHTRSIVATRNWDIVQCPCSRSVVYEHVVSYFNRSYKGWDSGLPDATPGDDYDGIIIELDPSTGLLTSRFFRVKSQPDRDERIYGACKPDGDQNDFYIVGMTTGNLLSTDAR